MSRCEIEAIFKILCYLTVLVFWLNTFGSAINVYCKIFIKAWSYFIVTWVW